MEIREASEEELDRLVEIWLAGSLQAHPFIPAMYWEENVPAMRGLYLPLAENHILLVEKRIVGFLSLMGEEVSALFVEPAEQQKGYGSKLINSVKGKRTKLALNVYAKNEAALAFYRRHDFVVTEKMLDEEVGEYEFRMEWQKERTE